MPIDSQEFEICRLQVTNSTEAQLRHSLACLTSDIYILHEHHIPKYDQYASNGGWLHPLVGKIH